MANAGRDIENSTEEDDPFQYAMRRANESWTAESENFDNGRDDQRFYAGEQWLPDARQERTDSNRPVITVNRLPGFIHQVTGDARKNTPSVKVAPAKDGASEEVAEIYNGLIRNIEVQSNAKAAYVQGLENACVTGLGSFRVKTQYSSDDAFEQDIRVERIPDPFAVLYDPAAREPDKADGRYVFILFPIPKETFRQRWPDAVAEGMPAGPNAIQGITWFSMQSIMVAEYWYKKPVKKTLYLMDDGSVLDDPKKAHPGVTVQQKREVETHKVCMRLMSGREFLTEEVEWAGKYIPICPVIGEEIFIEGRVVRRGMIRDAKDPQRVYNYMRTAAAEAAALQPKAPWVGTVKMFKGLERFWKTAGSKNHPYLPFNPDPAGGGAPTRAQPALAQQGLDSQAQIAGADLQAVVGVYNVSLGAPSNETSGRAINARNAQADTGTFNYVDNLGTAIQFCGRILVDLIPKIYDTARIVRVLGEDGTHKMVGVNQPNHQQLAGPDGQIMEMLNDLSVGEYDVTVITGPSFATRRQEAAQNMTELVRSYPKIADIAGDLVIKNMDFPGAEEIAARIKRTMPPQITGEAPDVPPPPPNPKDVAEAAKAKADADKSAAQAKLFTAQAEQAEIEAVGAGINVIQLMQQMNANVMALKAQIDALGTPPGFGGPPGTQVPGSPPVPPQLPPGGMPQMAELEPIPQ